MSYKHTCATYWIGIGIDGDLWQPAYSANYRLGAYGEHDGIEGNPITVNNVCMLEYETDNETDAQAVDDSPDTLVLHSENPDGSPRTNKNTLLTSGQRTTIVNFLKNKGVTDNQILWLRDRFAEQFGHPWSESTRGEAAKVIRYAVQRRFQ